MYLQSCIVFNTYNNITGVVLSHIHNHWRGFLLYGKYVWSEKGAGQMEWLKSGVSKSETDEREAFDCLFSNDFKHSRAKCSVAVGVLLRNGSAVIHDQYPSKTRLKYM